MPDEAIPYRNREIREMFDDVKEQIEKILTQIEKILTQTTMTNGRVGKLENWRSFITGGMSVILIVVVPLLGWALYVLSHIQSEVHNAVDEALAAYDIEK